ncbi:MAG: alpha-ribazole phosphatase [Deltaproteobacteria bacterium]|nr:MAG: alpha-ribazole phosphatase [Deltaproteobacteria bacterium]
MIRKNEPTRLIIVRHGEVEAAGALIGSTDSPLTGEGRETLRCVSRQLAGEPIAAVYASDLSRAVESASIIAEPHSMEVTVYKDFRELDMGRWDGVEIKTLLEDEKELLEAWWRDYENFKTPGGESLSDLKARVMGPLGTIVERHRGETVCLVAHGGVNRVILLDAIGAPLNRFHSLGQEYGAVNRIDYYEDGNAVVKLLNGPACI